MSAYLNLEIIRSSIRTFVLIGLANIATEQMFFFKETGKSTVRRWVTWSRQNFARCKSRQQLSVIWILIYHPYYLEPWTVISSVPITSPPKYYLWIKRFTKDLNSFMFCQLHFITMYCFYLYPFHFYLISIYPQSLAMHNDGVFVREN